MKTMMMVAGLVVGLSMMTGCAEATGAGSAPTTPAQAKWERKVLANGVELLISDEAGVDARKVADDIQSEMRSRYIGAR